MGKDVGVTHKLGPEHVFRPRVMSFLAPDTSTFALNTPRQGLRKGERRAGAVLSG